MKTIRMVDFVLAYISFCNIFGFIFDHLFSLLLEIQVEPLNASNVYTFCVSVLSVKANGEMAS